VQEVQHRLLLSIRDNGQGFDVRHTKGLGLLGIQERVTRLGGVCHVHSQPGIGTTLSVELPVSKDVPQGNVQENLGENRSARIRETDSHPVG
jgi:signal transduction histidine kinase